MAVKISSCRNWEIDKLIEEIKQPNIKVVIYFFSPSLEEYNPHTFFSETFPEAVCVGASMYGGWSSNGAVETGITAMSLSSDEVAQTWSTCHEGVKKNPVIVAYSAIIDLLQKTSGEKINPDEYLGLIFFDGLCLGEMIIKEFSMEPKLNMAFIGGAAADEMQFEKTMVCCDNRLTDDGLVAVILKMKIPFFFNHYVHYLPTDISFTITRVEIMQRIAWEINGVPAADFYAKQVGVEDASKLTSEIFAKNPLGLKLGGSIYIRSPKCVVNGNALQFYCYIEAGTRVFLLEQGDIIAHTEKSINKTSQFLPGIQGCIIFNCVQRHLELIEKNKIDEFNNVFKKYPMIGYNTYGEELFTHHNQTLTAVFFGTLPEPGMADPYKTKRLFHYTDSKLKSVVFDIVNRSELLNSTISFLKGSIDAENVLENYEVIKRSLGEMIELSNISKQDIERMLVVYQNNVEKTGEYVFNIVDEIRKQNRRLIELREEADMANRTKSSFLASMSHEIRTPMNAITGMAELLLRSELSGEARGFAHDIKQAGNNLISIINDILDFSKIEAGRLEIIPVKYMLSSLINDTVNIIRMRLKEKPIRFYTNIDSKIPNSLIGDEVRIRQILLNLLSNAAKFTDKGHVSLSITMLEKKDNQVLLKYTVSDSGHGITEEDQKKLFGEFVQVDLNRNRNIEGTGLGLAITKRLCAIMDGEVSMKSEFGKGSVFTVTIPQGINSQEPFASIDDAKNYKVLVYEGRLIYANSVCWSLENMGVPHKMVTTPEDFAEAVYNEKWSFVFSGYGLHRKIMKVMDKPELAFYGEKKPPLVLMVEWGTEAYIPNVRFVSLPVQSLSIANVLNGKPDIKGYSQNASVSGVIRYSFPDAQVLIVDDIQTNLKVAEGLLAPYHVKTDTCLSGPEAIELAKYINYDIIFMDHMMPLMDGIEATAHIREWEREQTNIKENYIRIPVIALTANAVSGVHEMFVEKGFDDFLAKPIDITKLDDILNRWISKDKRIQKTEKEETEQSAGDFPAINGIDVKKGINMTGGTTGSYYSVLSVFYKDVQERLKFLDKEPEKDNLPLFVTNVHALKGSSASIGAAEISAQAAKLESAGREGDFAFIRKNLKKFSEGLLILIKGIQNALDLYKADGEVSSENIMSSENVSVINLMLSELEDALMVRKTDKIDHTLGKIYKQPMDNVIKEAIDKISDDILMAEYESAVKKIEELLHDKS